MSLRPAIPVLLLLAAALPLSAISIYELDANASVLWIGTAPPLGDNFNPTTSYLLGVSLPLRIAGPFFLEPGLEMYGTFYRWDTASSIVVTTANDTGPGGFHAFGVLLSAQAGLSFDVAQAIALGGAIGLDFLFRFPFEFQNTDSETIASESSAMSYFYGVGRFFYPETRFFLRWRIIETIDLLLNVRAFYPLFHLWDGLSQPFVDQFMLSAGFGFAVRLTPAAK
jgi:hypothetical protein